MDNASAAVATPPAAAPAADAAGTPSKAIIEIVTEGNQVQLSCTFDPPVWATNREHLSHALAAMAMLAIAREIKGPKDHAYTLR